MKSIKTRQNLMNEYTITVKDAKTSKLKKSVRFHNTVTNWWVENILKTFQTVNSVPNSFYLGLGVGSGVHQASDTGLFQAIWNRTVSWYSLTIQHQKGDSFFTIETSIRLDESQGNGLLTELSISTGWSGSPGNCTGPLCLANFQDGEGNPITIEKTNSDVLDLTIKFQLTLDTSELDDNVHIRLDPQGQTYSGQVRQFSNPQVGKYFSNPELLRSFSYNLGTFANNYSYVNNSVGTWLLPFRDGTCSVSLNANKGIGFTDYNWYKSGTWSSEVVDGTRVYRATFTNVALSSEANLPTASSPYQIMSLGFNIDGSLLGIDFPDHDIFPPMELEFELLGDGLTTDFNLSVPVLMQDPGCTVTIDGQPILDSEYEWYGINWSTIQPWIVCDWNHVASSSANYGQWNSTTGIPTSPYYVSTSTSRFGMGNTQIDYDFGEALTIDCVGRLSTLGVTGAASIQYKINPEDSWTTIKSWASASAGFGLEQLSTPVTARYWRITPNVVPTADCGQRIGMPVIGDYATVTKPTIRFHTAPGIDSVIRIKAYTEYPCKSSDWIYRTLSIDLVKGVSSNS